MNRGVWFLAGSAAGAYVVTRARRAAEAFTYDGVHDRLSGLFVGARLFASEVRQGADQMEAELRERLELLPPATKQPTDQAPLPLEGPPLTLVRGNDR